MYRSRFEPWSHMLTGTLGKDPGWDPLQFVVDEGHKRGMEVHAWFNTFLIKSGKEKPDESQPRHLILTHPDWVRLVKGEWWLDPGIPEARQQCLTVAMDIVRNYDVDGIQFDFMRYSPNDFPDDKTWKRYGNGLKKPEWRRENINKFVRAFYDSATTVKPLLKIGSTPIGIYNSDAFKNGMRGYDDVYQDAKTWLKEGKMDYIVPQVYWSLKDSDRGPDFARITDDWIRGNSGRHIYVGIGMYKDDVARQVDRLIDTARSLGAQGQAFFRFDNIRRRFDSSDVYRTPALIPAMTWKDSLPPNQPLAFKVERDSSIFTTLRWEQPDRAQDGDRASQFVVYRSSHYPVDIDNPENILKQLSSLERTAVDSIPLRPGLQYHYAVSALDQENNESIPAQEEPSLVPEVQAVLKRFQPRWGIANLVPENSEKVLFILYEAKGQATIKFSIWDTARTGVQISFEEHCDQGKNLTTMDIQSLSSGTYILQAESELFSAQRRFSYKR